jgi:hypothetical protein
MKAGCDRKSFFAKCGGDRPSGQSGWFAYFRMGSDSVSDGSFRLLEV